jgi:hypothetical protein
MRCVAVAAAIITGVLALAMSIALATPSNADTPPTCILYGANGLCTVYSSDGGSVGSGGSDGASTTSSGGSDSSSKACHWDTSNGHAPGVVPCTTADGAVWNGYCYLKLMNPQPPKGVAGGGVWGGHTDGAVYQCSAPGPGESSMGIVGLEFWFAMPPPGLGPDPEQLAQRAMTTLDIPTPTPGRYPAGTLKDGRPYTVVGPAYTWYWTDAATFKPLSATATAGGISSTVTVTPSALTFTPGDGAAAVSCAGPGVAWNQRDGPWAASPVGCDYQYPHSSIHDPNGEVTATYGIRWTITWTSNVGDDGTLPDLTTTANSTFAVAEVESVVTH